jgi:hypothetical protein
VIVLAFALVSARPRAVAWALALFAGDYLISLEIQGDHLDRAAYVYSGLFLVTGELAYWSLELTTVRLGSPALVRRLAAVVLVAVGGCALAFVVLAASAVGSGGVALTAVGVLAAVGVVGLVTALALRAREQTADT